MIVQILAGAALAITGTLTIILGALFMISALGILHRHLVGIALIFAGAALLAWGIRFFIKVRENTTGGMRKQLLDLAEKHYGIVKASQIAVHLGKSEKVTQIVNSFLQEGTAEKRKSGDIILFVFPKFLQRRTCQTCGKNYILLTQETKCPHCTPTPGHKKKNPVAVS
jgi:Zn finger protein HypA/HybF involved in hydrogenase expression